MSERKEFPVKSVVLDCAKLEDIAVALKTGLGDYFAHVEVNIVRCPDLSKKPFNLAAKGLGGTTAVLDVGGPGFLLPLYNKSKIYHMNDIANIVGIKPCFLIGAGAGSWPYVGKNCEMIANVLIDESTIQKTHIAKVGDTNGEIIVETLPKTEMRFALLANLFACEGLPSQVLEVSCKKRRKPENFISAMKLILEKAFPGKTLGLGGTFLLKEGKAKQHIMPAFSFEPLNSEEELNKWLKFYEMSAPLIAVGTFVTKNIPEFDLREQHFHSFSDHGEGGHYHYDVTPETVEYLGYFNLGQTLYRIDQPETGVRYGKD